MRHWKLLAVVAAWWSTDHFEAEFRVICGDGGERHMDVRAIIHRDAQGSPVRIIARGSSMPSSP